MQSHEASPTAPSSPNLWPDAFPPTGNAESGVAAEPQTVGVVSPESQPQAWDQQAQADAKAAARAAVSAASAGEQEPGAGWLPEHPLTTKSTGKFVPVASIKTGGAPWEHISSPARPPSSATANSPAASLVKQNQLPNQDDAPSIIQEPTSRGGRIARWFGLDGSDPTTRLPIDETLPPLKRAATWLGLYGHRKQAEPPREPDETGLPPAVQPPEWAALPEESQGPDSPPTVEPTNEELGNSGESFLGEVFDGDSEEKKSAKQYAALREAKNRADAKRAAEGAAVQQAAEEEAARQQPPNPDDEPTIRTPLANEMQPEPVRVYDVRALGFKSPERQARVDAALAERNEHLSGNQEAINKIVAHQNQLKSFYSEHANAFSENLMPNVPSSSVKFITAADIFTSKSALRVAARDQRGTIDNLDSVMVWRHGKSDVYVLSGPRLIEVVDADGARRPLVVVATKRLQGADYNALCETNPKAIAGKIRSADKERDFEEFTIDFFTPPDSFDPSNGLSGLTVNDLRPLPELQKKWSNKMLRHPRGMLRDEIGPVCSAIDMVIGRDVAVTPENDPGVPELLPSGLNQAHHVVQANHRRAAAWAAAEAAATQAAAKEALADARRRRRSMRPRLKK